MNREFNDILNECLERLLVKGETLEQCLQSYPEHAAELKPLLQTALASRKLLDIKPSAEFKAKARYQFHSALAEAASKRRRPSLLWLPRWATSLILVIGLLITGGGTVAAASYSMPDSPLYTVKMATEQVQLGLTPSNEGKAELDMKLADRRVGEIIYLANKGDARKIEAVTQNLEERLEKFTGLVAAARPTAEAAKPVVSPTKAPDMPKAAAPSTQETPETQKVPTPTPAPAPPEAFRAGKDDSTQAGKEVYSKEYAERLKLKEALAHYAINHPAVLKAVLEKAPEASKPALRKTINILMERYEKALKALDD